MVKCGAIAEFQFHKVRLKVRFPPEVENSVVNFNSIRYD